MAESLRGQFLVAGKHLLDQNFFKTVVLVVEHNSEGAMGLVVNRPSSVSVASALSEHFNLPETDEPVHVGGPVEPAALFILHNAAEYEDCDRPVLPGLYVGSSADVFESVVRAFADGQPGMRFRVFSGCAGWAAGQLEGEISRGDWHVHNASSELTLAEDPYAVWDTCMQRIYEANRILPHTVQNPEWN